MSWRDQMGPASFRGVPFFVSTAERSGGRRTVVHEYPLRDVPFAEDMGRKPRSFQVDGYVIGDNYFTDRDNLLNALELGEPGELVHPYHGSRRVAVLNYRVRESSDRGGMAEFSIEFVETPAQPVQPSVVKDAVKAAEISVNASQASVRAEFLATYSPNLLLDGLAGALANAAATVDSAVSGLLPDPQTLAELKLKVAEIKSSARSLANAPGDLVDSLISLFDLAANTTVDALLTVYAFDPGNRPPATTTNRLIEQTNFDALQRLIQRLAAIQAAALAVTETFDSYEAALATRDAVAALLDEQTDIAADDTFPALLQLRADLTKAVPSDDSDLPRLLTHTPLVTEPSIILTFRLYGSLDLESDLLNRNRVRHPGFVLGGRALEVLSRD